MDFKDFSKEARLKEEARINDLTNKVVAKATKMALDKFSKVYGITTKVAAQKTDLKEFKHNYLSGKIASVLSIDTKNGVKEVPFTILVKASEPSILESDAIMQDKIANTEGSLEKEINAILARQNQKLANYEVEEENNKKIIADLSKGISLEASRKEHIFKEAKKGTKEVGHNSLSTVTTPTNIFNKLVDYFTYPKTFFPPMKVGAIVDIGGVKYKYIGDEATMTEPAGNTNGTIARFELANKKKASLNKKASLTEEDIKKIKDMAGYIADQDEEQQKRSLIDAALHLGYEEKDIEDAFGEFFVSPLGVATMNKKAGDDLKYFKLFNLLNEYTYNGLLSNIEDIEGKKVLTGSPEVVNDLEHKVKDIGYYCDVVDETTGVEGEIPERSLRIYMDDKIASEKEGMDKEAAGEEKAKKTYDFTDEAFLNTNFSEVKEKGYGTMNSIQQALSDQFGYGGASSLTNIRRRLERENKTTIKDLYERVKALKAQPKVEDTQEQSKTEKMSEEEKKDFFVEKDTDVLSLSDADAKEFFKNDLYVEENIKNWGLSPEDAAAFIDSRNYFNEGLLKNKVNDQLVEVAAQDPKAAYSALIFLLKSGAKSAVSDDSKIAEEYKVALFQSAANGDPDKNLKDFPQDIVEKYAYNEETFRIKEEAQNPIEETSDGYKTIIEEKVRAAIRGKSPEQIKEYCEKYKVIDTIKEELARLKEEINSYTKEQRAEVGTTFEEEDEETIEKEESLKVKAEPEDIINKTDELEEGFEEEMEKAKKEFSGEAPAEQGKTVSDVEKEVVLKETTIPEKDDEEMEDILESTTKGVNPSEAVQTEIDSLRADYARYKTLKRILEKLEGALSKVNGENND